MEHTEFRIEQVKERLTELALKDSTPRKYAGLMLEAYEIIKQREKELAKVRERKAPLTRGDHIRSMSDEEYAKYLAGDDCGKFCRNLEECREDLDAGKVIPDDRCAECALLWLKQVPEEAQS